MRNREFHLERTKVSENGDLTRLWGPPEVSCIKDLWFRLWVLRPTVYQHSLTLLLELSSLFTAQPSFSPCSLASLLSPSLPSRFLRPPPPSRHAVMDQAARLDPSSAATRSNRCVTLSLFVRLAHVYYRRRRLTSPSSRAPRYTSLSPTSFAAPTLPSASRARPSSPTLQALCSATSKPYAATAATSYVPIMPLSANLLMFSLVWLLLGQLQHVQRRHPERRHLLI